MIERFMSATILRHFNDKREVILGIDASDYVSAGVLLYSDNEGVLHLVAFFSKTHSLAQCNDHIYDKEVLAIIKAHEEWRPACQGVAHPMHLRSHHKNLVFFMSHQLLND
jgi:hypothetical protein